LANTFNRDLLLGYWYRGESDSEGNQITEFARLESNGTFEFLFIQYNQEGDVIEEITELGDWRVYLAQTDANS